MSDFFSKFLLVLNFEFDIKNDQELKQLKFDRWICQYRKLVIK